MLEMSISACCSIFLSRNPMSVRVNRLSFCTLPVVVTTNSIAGLEGTRVTYAESGCVTPQRRCGGQLMGLLSVAIVSGAAFLGKMCKNAYIKKSII